ncbi:MAG: DDE-type integrase/transposase/recombinase, partial [Colwellia sp.]|nr:DDE-type integrase/transposase/recombinase [Colwellia sp.]
KFFFFYIKYLGIIVTADGLRADQKYIDQVIRLKRSESSKEVERYCGMIQWLGRFIPNLSKLLAPINALKKKNQRFQWTSKHQKHFEAVQRALNNAKLLRHPDFTKPYFVQTDASKAAIGAVLLQDFGNGFLEPIEFISRKFTSAEDGWHASERELVAVVFALRKWIRYLLPTHFTVFTDHKNLKNLFENKEIKIGKLQRWVIFLQQFDFTAHYLPGKDNYIADYLSRDAQNVDEIVREERPILAVPQTPTIASELHASDLRNEMLHIMTPTETPTVFTAADRPKRVQRSEYYVPSEHEPITADPGFGKLKKDQVDHVAEDGLPQSTILFPTELNQRQEIEDFVIYDEDFGKHINVTAFRKEQKTDKFCKIIRDSLRTGEPTEFNEFNKQIKQNRYKTSHEDILFRRNDDLQWTPVVPKTLRKYILKYFHESHSFNHQGINRTYHTLRQYFYWPNQEISISEANKQCDACQHTNARTDPRSGARKPWISTDTFEDVSCDLIGPMPITDNGNRYALTIMDRFSKYGVVVTLQDIRATTIVKAILEHWIYVYGAPKRILSDNGTQFASIIWKLVMKTIKTKILFTTACNPEANGMIERFHDFIKKKLSIRAFEKKLDYWSKDNWDIYIACIVYSYNATVHTATGHAPFKILFGKNVRLALDFPALSEEDRRLAVNYDEYLIQFTHQLQILKNKSFAKQYRVRLNTERRLNEMRPEFVYEVGELVLKHSKRWVGNKKKLQSQYEGPYEILEKAKNGITFKIQHLETKGISLIHGKHLAPYKKELLSPPNEEKELLSPQNEDSHDTEVIQLCEEILGFEHCGYLEFRR